MDKILLIHLCENMLDRVATQQNASENLIFKLVTTHRLDNSRFNSFNDETLNNILNQLIGMNHVYSLQKEGH